MKTKFLCAEYGNLELGTVKFKQGLSSRLRRALEGSCNYDSLDTLIEYVLQLDFEQRFNDRLEGSVEKANPAVEKNAKKGGNHSGSKPSNHKWVCFYCGRERHKVYECRLKKSDERKGKVRKREDWAYPNGRFTKKPNLSQGPKLNDSRASEQANYVGEPEDENDELAFILNEESKESIQSWAIDSGATSHMTGCRDLLTDIQNTGKKRVELADGSHIEYTEAGVLKLRIVDGNQQTKQVTLNDVKYIPGSGVNLISVRKLVEKGCMVKFCLNEQRENTVQICSGGVYWYFGKIRTLHTDQHYQ